MNAQDWLGSLALSSLLLPYGKAAGKYLSTHLPSLCLGVVSYVVSKPHTKEGDTMNPKERKLDPLDVLAAHPFCIPLWAAVFGWMVQTFGIGFYWLIPLFCFAFWFYSYLNSASRLFAYYAAQEPHPSPSPLLTEVKP